MAMGPLGLLEFTGLKELEPLEQTIVKGIAQEYFPVLQRALHNDIDVLVHIKPYGKGGKREKYSIHVKVIYTEDVIDVNMTRDWDLPRGIHEAFVAALNIAKKRFDEDSTKYAIRKSTQKSEKQIKRREWQVSHDKKKSRIRRNANKRRNSTY